MMLSFVLFNDAGNVIETHARAREELFRIHCDDALPWLISFSLAVA
jgi:hypothetical protein